MAYANGWVLPDAPEVLSRATPEQLEKLLTAVIRADRFCDGALAGERESGLLARVCRRASVVLADIGVGNGEL